MRIDLGKIKLGYQSISDSIYLYRHGKQCEHVALDQREAFQDVLQAFFDYMFKGSKHKGVRTQQFNKGNVEYDVMIIAKNKGAENADQQG